MLAHGEYGGTSVKSALSPPARRKDTEESASNRAGITAQVPPLACPGTPLYGGLWATLRTSKMFFRLKTACKPRFAGVPGQLPGNNNKSRVQPEDISAPQSQPPRKGRGSRSLGTA